MTPSSVLPLTAARSFVDRLRVIVRTATRSALPTLMLCAVALTTACQDAAAPEPAGEVTVEFDGLPSGGEGIIRLTKNGVTKTMSAAGTFEGLEDGEWTLSASATTIDGVVYEPNPATALITVSARTVRSARVIWTPIAGSLQLSVQGLPAGVNADIVVSSLTTTRTVTGSANITALPPGVYTISARDVRASDGTQRAEVMTQTVSIVASPIAANASVMYRPAPAAVAIDVSGLPAVTAALTLTSPTGTVTPVGGTTRLSPVTAGRWRLQAEPLQANGFTYTPTPALHDTTVSAGDTLRLPVAYAVSTGALAVAVTGLPVSAAGSVRVTGPGGFSRVVNTTQTLTDIAPGVYTVNADAVIRNNLEWVPSQTSQQVTVTASVTAAPATVAYTAISGTFVVSVSGVPVGGAGSVRVTGPHGFDRTISTTTVFTATAVGTYTLTATSFTAGGFTYSASPSTVTRTVSVGLRDSVDVQYAAQVGSAQVTVSGLPGGVSANLTLTRGSQSTPIAGSTTLTGLAVGSYTLSASAVSASGTTYLPTPTTQTVTVTNGVQSTAAVAYAAVVSAGSLQVNIVGLPLATSGSVVLTGNSQTINIAASTTLSALAVGSYVLTASTVNISGTNYTPTPSSQNITISNGVQSTATVTYAAVVSGGSLQVAISGLPGGTNAAVTLTGATTTNITGSTTVSGLAAGTYTLSASSVSASGTTYTPAPTSQTVTITNGATTNASIAYTGAPALIDLVLDAAYVTQATQKMDGSVALVAGRDALLRVFAHADRANTVSAAVRARIYDGTTLLQTLNLTRAAAGVPTAVTEGTLTSSWNALISAANIRPALRILVDIDPTNAVAEADETNNIYPSTGTPQSLTVNTVPAFNVRFVPVTVGSLTGNVSGANMNSFLVSTRQQWPVGTVNAEVRAPFTSSADTLRSNDSNNQWLTVLSEMNSLRAADGAPSNMHYYGVVKVGYSSGIAGYGYVPGRAAMGWDHLPSGDEVAAHEWGHNFSRPHAPCGGVASPDPSYPYAGGIIGSFGWNSTTNALVPTSHKDLMGYCDPTWVSDYNWSRVMTYRQSAGAVAASAPGDGLLVWGRIVNGAVQLEPAFRITAPRTAAATRPTHVVEALDANGAVLLELPITADRVDHVTAYEERHFSAIVPWTPALEEALTRVRVRDLRSPILAATRTSPAAAAAGRVRGARSGVLAMPDPQSSMEAAAGGRVRVRWDQAAYPMAMVRDAATGQIMGYVRKSGDSVVSGGRTLELLFSDGARTRKE